jgi:hypothetical protein
MTNHMGYFNHPLRLTNPMLEVRITMAKGVVCSIALETFGSMKSKVRSRIQPGFNASKIR